ncbi:MAG: hypothetical protein WAO74_01970 [Polaribacter sp.]|uniref:hypothetical protein n=1 Tax=Polaribacter sp. TaxID=1920175 RepID=UPI003BAEFB0D
MIKSTNQHGVHSPFVYDFVNKGLYKKDSKNNTSIEYSELKNLSKKEKKILSKIIAYFNIDTIYFDIDSLNKTLDKDYKLLYINNILKFNLSFLNQLKSKDILIIKGIHHNKNSNQAWLKIIKHKETTVTIDLFYFGIIFLRKKQAKEHFIIRV